MPNEEKSVCIIEFPGKKADWESWSKKFLLHGKWKGYKKLLVNSASKLGMDEIPTQDEYHNTLKGNLDIEKKIINMVS